MFQEEVTSVTCPGTGTDRERALPLGLLEPTIGIEKMNHSFGIIARGVAEVLSVDLFINGLVRFLQFWWHNARVVHIRERTTGSVQSITHLNNALA